ncbi:hypothetical protein [Nonomuraea dietziae]|uniref:hypothetical protein n=1 Tax=Nonomuraea dietziae TaxID=65515 RepID=UPI0033CB6FC5
MSTLTTAMICLVQSDRSVRVTALGAAFQLLDSFGQLGVAAVNVVEPLQDHRVLTVDLLEAHLDQPMQLGQRERHSEIRFLARHSGTDSPSSV